MPRPCASAGMLVAALLGVVTPALALDDDDALTEAQRAIVRTESDFATVRAAMDRAHRLLPTPQQRIAAGDMLLRIRDYDRSIDTLSKVLELYRQGKMPVTAYADALYLISEAYFKSEQYLSAQRHYREILDHGTQNPFDSYLGRALARLVDVALRTHNLDALDYVFERMESLPQTDATGSLQYGRGKAYYARENFASARSALLAVPPGSDYSHQAFYLMGVILMKEALAAAPAPAEGAALPVGSGGAPPSTQAPASAPPSPQRFAAAIEQFRQVTRMAPDSEEHRHVIDVAWMAIGRLFYETDNYLDAVEAYSHVDRASPEFPEMLFELAWVYVRVGDYQRAQRALEVLSITAPESLNFADSSLLRADLMLRSKKFTRALSLYETVRERFDPMREQVDIFLKSTTDPAVYYDRLVEDNLVSARRPLPQTIIEWVREAAEEDRAFAVIDEVTRSRTLIRESRRLARKLGAVLRTSTRVKAFPELKAGLERTHGLLNQLAMARRALALGMEDVDDSPLGGEIGQARRERRRLMRRLQWLPVTDADFIRRETSGERQWNRVSQRLQRLTLEADRLQAVVNGLNRVLREADKFGVTRDPGSRQQFAAQVVANERDLQAYREQIKALQEIVDIGRAQIGFGDQRYVEDDQVRSRFNQLLEREVVLAAAGHGGEALSEYAKSVVPLLARAQIAEQRLTAMRRDLDMQVLREASILSAMVAEEARNIEEYAVALDTLDENARILVGEVAMRNFGVVRDRLKNIVLRADVGIVQQAWEVREEQLTRVRELQRERAREEQNLNDELREVIDDAGGEE